MEQKKLKEIYKTFAASGAFISAKLLNSGHFKDIYHLIADEEAAYILQYIHAINFPHIPDMIRNKEMVSGHIRNKLIQHKIHDITRKYITYFQTYRKQPYYKDHEGNYWTLSLYIKGARYYEKTTSPQIAYEIGTGLGKFENRTSDFNPALLKESLPLYQHIPTWQKRLSEAFAAADAEKQAKSKEMVTFLHTLEHEGLMFQKLRDDGQLPIRVTHNAFTCRSLLLDWNDRSLCVTGLDLVMPGLVHYDFGDAACSVCNPAGEDYTNLNEICFDIDLFREFAAGFMGRTLSILTHKEKATLPLACKVMPYLHALRYLTMYLTGEKFYPTDPEQNFLQAKARVILLQSVIEQYTRIQQHINTIS